MEKVLLLIQTGTADPGVRAESGDYDRQFSEALHPIPLRVVDARAGSVPAPDEEVAGVLITGSASMVTDREPWSEELARWLARVVADRVPVLGVCYGHQLLAHALGGEVGWNPGGPHLGPAPVRFDAAASRDPVMAGLGSVQFYDHSQQVLRVPREAVLLAASPSVPIAAFRVGDSAWGVQFHPEWSRSTFRAVLREGADTLARRGATPDTVPLPDDPWPGRRLLRAFAQRAGVGSDLDQTAAGV